MPEPEHDLDAKVRLRALEQFYARIEREGCEVDTDDPESRQTCVNRSEKKRGNRRVYEPCGAKAVVVMTMRSPDDPQGLRVPLCRGCLAKHARKMITLLELFG
jgi:hypothetical protein